MAPGNSKLTAIKIVHTVVWAFFASCTTAIPLFAWRNSFSIAAILACIVLAEVVVLGFNGWVCPLTPIAAKFTENRTANFDIFLPEWLAKYNKHIFGTMYLFGILYAISRWVKIRG